MWLYLNPIGIAYCRFEFRDRNSNDIIIHVWTVNLRHCQGKPIIVLYACIGHSRRNIDDAFLYEASEIHFNPIKLSPSASLGFSKLVIEITL